MVAALTDFDALVEFTKKKESFRSLPYVDPEAKKAGVYRGQVYPNDDNNLKWTIGFGQLCRDIGFPDNCTGDEATEWLIAHLQDDQLLVENKILKTYNIDESYTYWLVALVYQMGIGNLLKFKKALTALELNQIDTAKLEFADSPWAKSQSPARARELIEML